MAVLNIGTMVHLSYNTLHFNIFKQYLYTLNTIVDTVCNISCVFALELRETYYHFDFKHRD